MSRAVNYRMESLKELINAYAFELSDGKLTETIKADYFSTLHRIDRATFYKKAHSSRKYGTLLSELTRSDSRENI